MADGREREARDLLPWTKQTLPDYLLLCMHDSEDCNKVVARTPDAGLWVSVAEVEVDGEVGILNRASEEDCLEFDLDIGMRVDILRAETGCSWQVIVQIMHFENCNLRPEVIALTDAMSSEPNLQNETSSYLQRGAGMGLLLGALERWHRAAVAQWLKAAAPPPTAARRVRTVEGGLTRERRTPLPEGDVAWLPSALAGVGGPATGWLQPAELPEWLGTPTLSAEALLRHLRPDPPCAAKASAAKPAGSKAAKACAGACGYAVTWHPTHCCNFCAVGRGHGARCARVPLPAAGVEKDPEVPAVNRQLQTGVEAPPVPTTFWPLRAVGGAAAEAAPPSLAARTAELHTALAALDFAGVFARLDAKTADCMLDGGRRAVHACVETGCVDLLKMVIAARADVNVKDSRGRSPLQLAATRGDMVIARHLLDVGAETSASEGQAATELQDVQGQVQSLLEERERPWKYGEALLRALKQRDVRTAEAALEARADVNSVDARGYGPLLLLAKGLWKGQETQQVQFAQQLVAAAAAVQARDGQGAAPLHHAAHHGNLQLVEALLQLRADVGAATAEGSTPLMHAAHSGHEDVCTALLEAFSPCATRNAHGLTAERIANKKGFRRCAVLIQAYEMAPKRPGEDDQDQPRKANMSKSQEDSADWSALEKLLQEQQATEETSKYKQAMALMRGPKVAPVRRTGAFDYSHWEGIVNDLEQKEALKERQELLEQSPEFIWRDGVRMRVML